MKKWIFPILFGLILFSLAVRYVVKRPTEIKQLQTTIEPARYTLIWSDEFDGTSLDTTKWLNPARTECSPSNSHGQEIYHPDDAYLENGHLVLRSQHRSYGGCSYTSGAVSTRGKFTQAYGRFEIRAQLPAGGQGIWPALWLYPPNQWPPEIDILEAVNDMSVIHMNYHWGTPSDHRADLLSYHDDGFLSGFHTFAIEWEPGEIRWFIDGVLRKTHASSNVTDIPMMIFMNTAVGGVWSGPVGDDTAFPQYFYIDYIRTYAKLATSSPSPSPSLSPSPSPSPAPTTACSLIFTVAGISCKDLSGNTNVSLNDTVTFSCSKGFSSTEAVAYFRALLNDDEYTKSAAVEFSNSDNAPWSVKIDKTGDWRIQCRICNNINQVFCTAWGQAN